VQTKTNGLASSALSKPAQQQLDLELHRRLSVDNTSQANLPLLLKKHFFCLDECSLGYNTAAASGIKIIPGKCIIVSEGRQQHGELHGDCFFEFGATEEVVQPRFYID
jgi:hypothetical protein